MAPSNPQLKVETSTLEVSKTFFKLQSILENKGYTCKILNQGQLARHKVEGKSFFPPEFPVQIKFTLSEPSDEKVTDSLLAAILEQINNVHTRNVSSKVYVTIRNPELFALTTTKVHYTAQMYISVLSV